MGNIIEFPNFNVEHNYNYGLGRIVWNVSAQESSLRLSLSFLTKLILSWIITQEDDINVEIAYVATKTVVKDTSKYNNYHIFLTKLMRSM